MWEGDDEDFDKSPIENVVDVLDIEEDTTDDVINLPPTDFSGFDTDNNTFNDEETVDRRVSDC